VSDGGVQTAAALTGPALAGAGAAELKLGDGLVELHHMSDARLRGFLREPIVDYWMWPTVVAMVVAYTTVPALLASKSVVSIVASIISGLVLGGFTGIMVIPTMKAAIANKVDRRALIAFLPAICASGAFLIVHVLAKHLPRSGSLEGFYETAAALLGLLLISIMIEARALAQNDPWIRAARGMWVTFIVIGIVYALVGLTPGQSPTSQQQAYALVWFSIVFAVTALLIVLWRKSPPLPQAAAQQRKRSRATRTRARATRA
jgi:succinate dehydrogenase/fumarate reductase cytochrome b subunit